VVGQKRCGKTTMMHSAVGNGDLSQAGSALVDFWCIRKTNPGERSETACVWELPGDDAVSQALSAKDKVGSTTHQACTKQTLSSGSHMPQHADSNANSFTCILPACKIYQHSCCRDHGGLIETLVSRRELHHMDPAGNTCFK
jgi:hypothetical protein